MPPAFRGARGCPGRVAPFGDLGLTGCQRLPRAFRRVAASFLGRQRQGIHHAPIMRISCYALLREDRDPRPQTGTRQRDGPVWPHLLRTYRQTALAELAEKVPLVPAQLGPFAAAQGAAFRCLYELFPVAASTK